MTQQYLEQEISDLKTRLKIVEDNLNGLIVMVGKLRSNTNDDINGTRQSISNITPFVSTKQAYFGDNQVTFYDVPEGNVSVFFDSYLGPYSYERVSNMLTVQFDTLTVASTNITISIQ